MIKIIRYKESRKEGSPRWQLIRYLNFITENEELTKQGVYTTSKYSLELKKYFNNEEVESFYHYILKNISDNTEVKLCSSEVGFLSDYYVLTYFNENLHKVDLISLGPNELIKLKDIFETFYNELKKSDIDEITSKSNKDINKI